MKYDSNFTGKTVPRSEFYLCGNGAMINDTTNTLLRYQVSKDKIFTERFYDKSAVS